MPGGRRKIMAAHVSAPVSKHGSGSSDEDWVDVAQEVTPKTKTVVRADSDGPELEDNAAEGIDEDGEEELVLEDNTAEYGEHSFDEDGNDLMLEKNESDCDEDGDDDILLEDNQEDEGLRLEHNIDEEEDELMLETNTEDATGGSAKKKKKKKSKNARAAVEDQPL